MNQIKFEKNITIIIILIIGLNLCSGMKRQLSNASSSSQRSTKHLPTNDSTDKDDMVNIRASSRFECRPDHLLDIQKDLKASFLRKREKLYENLGFKPNYFAISKCKITVHRSKNIVRNSFDQILSKKSLFFPNNFKNTLNIVFAGERGVDFGALAKEWIKLVSTGMVDKEFGLFDYCDNYRIKIRSDENQTWKNIEYFEAAGILTGIAIHQRHLLNVSFSEPLLRSILGKPIELDDIRTADKMFHKRLTGILNHKDPSVMNLEYKKKESAGILFNKKVKNKVLKVDNKNKADYVQHMISESFIKGIELPLSKFLNGLKSVIPLSLLTDFNEEELDLLISGVQTIDMNDWEKNTSYKCWRKKDDTVVWFWQIVKGDGFSHDLRVKLLEFVTGSKRVPPDGFAGFKSKHDENPPFTISWAQKGSYPSANTCDRTLFLPQYKFKSELNEKLRISIQQQLEFNKL